MGLVKSCTIIVNSKLRQGPHSKVLYIPAFSTLSILFKKQIYNINATKPKKTYQTVFASRTLKVWCMVVIITLSPTGQKICSSLWSLTNKESKLWKDVNVAEQIGLQMAKSKWLEAQHALMRNSLRKDNPHMYFNTLHSAPRCFPSLLLHQLQPCLRDSKWYSCQYNFDPV